MNQKAESCEAAGVSRRDFLKRTGAGAAAAGLAGGLSIERSAHAAGDDMIKIAFIGCGGRGTGACTQALSTKGPVKLVAMADAFGDRIESSLANLLKNEEIRGKIDVPKERQFVGYDAHLKAIACDVDLVLLTTPPGFRPAQYEAAVNAGKHVFMEKPCCVDGPGFRRLLATNEVAKKKGLSVGVGLERRHQANYLEGIQQIRDGAVGQIMYLRTYFNMPGAGFNDRGKPEGQSELEYQVRRWGMFTWLSGDHIVEQAVHVIDIANWIMDDHPVQANGMGGRQVRRGRGNGQIYDHHFVEYEFADGVRHYAQARQIGRTWSHVSDNVHGTKKTMTLGSGPYGYGGAAQYGSRGKRPTGYRGVDPFQQEHDELAASIRGGPRFFEGDYAATSSMTAVLGRMATYSGKVVTWDEAVASEMKLGPDPDELAANPEPPVLPDKDGHYPVAMPGITKAW